MNKYFAIGRLGQDPELRFLDSGSCVVNFSLAVSERAKRGGQWVDDVVWIKCEAWGKLASDVIGQYCRKGDQIAIEGKLKAINWKDRQTGQDRRELVVNVGNVTLLGAKGQGQQDGSRPMDQYEDEF